MIGYVIRSPSGEGRGVMSVKEFDSFRRQVNLYRRDGKYYIDENGAWGNARMSVWFYRGDTIALEDTD